MPNLRLEQIHIEQFIKLFFNSSIGFEQQQPPEPDFKVKLDEKVIGIEHTRLIRKPDKNNINVMGHYKVADKIMHKAELLYNTTESMCLMVNVSFRCDYGLITNSPKQLYNNDIQELSHFIADFVKLQLPKIVASKQDAYFTFYTYDFNTGQQVLPEKINHITITNTKSFEHSCWAANQGGVIPGIYKSEEFEITLNNKNKKPQNYKNEYDEIWLLIVEDSMDLTSYFHFDDQSTPEIESNFNRVFVLRKVENCYIELSLRRN